MIIDFRARPPAAEFTTIATLEVAEFINKRVGADDVAPSFRKQSLETFLEEMQQGGISAIVMHGRHTPTCDVPDTTVSDLQNKYPEKLYGFAGTNLTSPLAEVLEGIEYAVKVLGLRGVTVEPGTNAVPMYPDDRRLYPIYAKCADLKVPLLLMSGPWAGPDLSYTDPIYFEHVATDFPELPIVLGHGCYPFVTQVIGLIYKRANVYCSPDCYLFAPGRDAYVEAINLYEDQFLYGSAYPFRPMPHSVEDADKLPIEPEAREKFYWKNAARLLGIAGADTAK